MKIFDLYSTEGIEVKDAGLKKYINLDAKIMLKSHGRHRDRLAKYTKMNIVERLANQLQVPGHRRKKHIIMTSWASGKYEMTMKIVLEAFKIIEGRLKINPVQVFVKAIENSAPRDEITVIEYGGARYPQAVDVAPARRVSLVLRYFVHGAYDKSFNKKTKMFQALAEEIIKAYEGNQESYALQRKNESERQADGAR
jgi:small subunit ribosomal protein S7